MSDYDTARQAVIDRDKALCRIAALEAEVDTLTQQEKAWDERVRALEGENKGLLERVKSLAKELGVQKTEHEARLAVGEEMAKEIDYLAGQAENRDLHCTSSVYRDLLRRWEEGR